MGLNIEKGPAAFYTHSHPSVRNINEEFDKALTLGQRVADTVATVLGSWPFIIIQSLLICIWIGINVYLVYMIHTHPNYLKAWDPYPFILLNLVLSLQAAYTGPVVMMSQNRQNYKDRLAAQHDYEINVKAEEEIKVLMTHLCHQDEMTGELLRRLDRIESIEKGFTSSQEK
ncbi:MAG TPA: DUF1003 domain-containing protein [Syntrophomonadaceae bacterium]|nr:DUF1003 domain-containing protein [Syntrophomonadaceae bacterium]